MNTYDHWNKSECIDRWKKGWMDRFRRMCEYTESDREIWPTNSRVVVLPFLCWSWLNSLMNVFVDAVWLCVLLFLSPLSHVVATQWPKCTLFVFMGYFLCQKEWSIQDFQYMFIVRYMCTWKQNFCTSWLPPQTQRRSAYHVDYFYVQMYRSSPVTKRAVCVIFLHINGFGSVFASWGGLASRQSTELASRQTSVR